MQVENPASQYAGCRVAAQTILLLDGYSMIDEMRCPWCHGTAKRDPHNREDRFICDCGWVSWKTRIELLQYFLSREGKEQC